MRAFAAGLAAGLGLFGAGCVTTERVQPALRREQDEAGNVTYRSTRRVRVEGEAQAGASEDDLRAAVAARPDDPSGWLRLGEHYEFHDRPADALPAYLRFHKLAQEYGRLRGRDFVEADFYLGRIYALLGDWIESRHWLLRVLEREPRDRPLAARSPWFREAHYLLGSIDFAHDDWTPAERHLRRYVSLTGDEARVAGMLARIERELYPERFSSNYAKIR